MPLGIWVETQKCLVSDFEITYWRRDHGAKVAGLNETGSLVGGDGEFCG